MANIELYDNRGISIGVKERPFQDPGLFAGEIFMNGYQAANRIRGAIPVLPWQTINRVNGSEFDFENRNIRSLLTVLPPGKYRHRKDQYFGANPLPPDMAWGANYWITDEPQAVYGTGDVYTVTSTLAVKNLKKHILTDKIEGVLTPPIEHLGGIHTHRGISLELFSTVMDAFGIGLGDKDRNVWLAPQIDGEQVVKEDKIARNGTEIDKQIWSVLFEGKFSPLTSTPHKLHPQLEKFITAIIERRNRELYKRDADFAEYADTLLNVFGHTLGVRDGWYTELEGVLKGTVQPVTPPDFSLQNFWESMFYRYERGTSAIEKSQVAVLRVSKERLFEEVPIYRFPLSNRPPGTIIPAPRVPISAVTGIYIENMDNPPVIADQLQGLLRPLDELPMDVWLPDAAGQPVTPNIARARGINPHEPLCAVRYNGNPVEQWMRLIENGTIAPLLTDIKSNALLTPKNMGERAVQRLVLQKLGYSTSDPKALDLLSALHLSGTIIPSVASIEPLPYR